MTFEFSPTDWKTKRAGPIAAKLLVLSTSDDADLFVTLQPFSPARRDMDFQGTIDPHMPLAQGYLPASLGEVPWMNPRAYRFIHSKLHSQNEKQPLMAAEVCELDVEIRPKGIILSKAFGLALQISGRDFAREWLNESWVSHGSGPFLHDSLVDRPEEIFDGETTIHTGESAAPFYLLLPVIRRE